MLTHDALKRQLDGQTDQLIQAIRSELGPDEAMRERLLREHSVQMSEVRAELLVCQGELESATAELDRMRLRTPAQRGAAFERYVAETLSHFWPHVAVEDVSKRAHATDLLVEVPGPDRPVRIGIDAKDRATTPTLAELARFISDIDQYDGGVLVLRNRCALQPGWRRVADHLVEIGPRAYIVTGFELNPGMLGCALTGIVVDCSGGRAAAELETDPAPLNRLLAAVAAPLRETVQLVTKFRDGAAALLRQLADQHVPVLQAAAADAIQELPRLQTVELTSALPAGKRPRAQ